MCNVEETWSKGYKTALASEFVGSRKRVRVWPVSSLVPALKSKSICPVVVFEVSVFSVICEHGDVAWLFSSSMLENGGPVNREV